MFIDQNFLHAEVAYRRQKLKQSYEPKPREESPRRNRRDRGMQPHPPRTPVPDGLPVITRATAAGLNEDLVFLSHDEEVLI